MSPLQVAILFQLVDQRGSAPIDRLTLFADHLSIVIKREQEKQGSIADYPLLKTVHIGSSTLRFGTGRGTAFDGWMANRSAMPRRGAW